LSIRKPAEGTLLAGQPIETSAGSRILEYEYHGIRMPSPLVSSIENQILTAYFPIIEGIPKMLGLVGAGWFRI
jgi:hypothetical protein